jgi:hypothetical protein
MVPEAQRLHAAFVSALPAYLTALFAERGYPADRASVESIESATAVLDAELGSELELAFREQRRSPLEIVRWVLAIPSSALAEAGVSSSGVAGSVNDVDPYDLAPGSSSALGPEAHEAHLRWGIAKATAFTSGALAPPADPVVLVMAESRADREELMAAVEGRGMLPTAVRNPVALVAAIERRSVVLAVVDLSHRSAREAIARLTGATIVTIVYGDSIDDLMETGLRAQGVRDVVDRRRLLADPSAFLPLLA